jgi:hypothetical protein
MTSDAPIRLSPPCPGTRSVELKRPALLPPRSGTRSVSPIRLGRPCSGMRSVAPIRPALLPKAGARP